MTPRLGVLILAVTFMTWSGACVWIGWSVGDARRDEAAARVAAVAHETRARNVEHAREVDHANEQHAASVELERINALARISFNFEAIEKAAQDYAITNPDAHSCDLAGDGMRAWRAANAGQFPSGPGLGDSAGTVGAVPGSPADAGERQP